MYKHTYMCVYMYIHIHTIKYLSAIKMNEIVPFAATWVVLEIIILSKPDRERQISYNITYLCNIKKNDTNELIYKTEIRPTDLENKFMVTTGEVGEE